MLGDVNKLFVFKSLLTTPSNVLPLHLKQTFLPIIWIFTEGEGDGINSRLPFKIFSTLTSKQKNYFRRLAIQLSILGGITIISLGGQATKWVFIHEKRSCTILLNFSWRFELEWQMPTHDAINLEPKSRLVMIRFLKRCLWTKQVS